MDQHPKQAKVFWFFFSKKNFFLKKEAKTFALAIPPGPLAGITRVLFLRLAANGQRQAGRGTLGVDTINDRKPVPSR